MITLSGGSKPPSMTWLGIGEAMGTRRHCGDIAGEGGNRFLQQPVVGCGAACVSYDHVRRTGGVMAMRGVQGDGSFDWVWDRSN